MVGVSKIEYFGDVLIDLTQDTITSSDVLSNKTFHSRNGTIQVGSMIDNGAISEEIKSGDIYTIPVGYHNGFGVVKANGALPTNFIAEEYSNEKTYETGSFVIHDDFLYKCISPILEPSNWNSSFWEKTDVSKHMSDSTLHVSEEDREYWNSKLNSAIVSNEKLVIS